MNKEKFLEELKKINISLTNKQLEQLEEYYQLLVKENQLYNLTSITKKEDVYLKHFYDSLTITKVINLNSQSLCDIGTGAGFPGIVLKIVYPNLNVTLVEATTKKCHFLELVINKLDLKNIEIINERVEILSINTREKYDIITSRAVANIKILLEMGISLLKVNGYFICLKGKVEEELVNIDNYYNKLEISLIKKEEFKLPIENSLRTILSYKKLKKTNNIYPRKYNDIIKKTI